MAYDNPRDYKDMRAAASISQVEKEGAMETRIDKLEKALLTAIEKNDPTSPSQGIQPAERREPSPIYQGPDEIDGNAQVNTTGHWNPNGSWNPGRQRDAPWRDHPNFRWNDGNQNKSNPHQNAYPGSSNPDYQPNWSGRTQNHNQHQIQNPKLQSLVSNYVPPHQRNYQSH